MHRSDTKLRRFQETMNIYLFVVLLFCLNFTFSLDVTRNHDGDTLKCDTKIDCLSSGAVNTNENTCFCDEGTYFLLVNKLSCIKDNGKTAGCNFKFSYYPSAVQAISVSTIPAQEFSYEIKTGTTCRRLNMLKVELLNKEMLSWMEGSNDFKIYNLMGTNSYFLRWKDANNVKTSVYEGQLLKVSLQCEKNDGTSVYGCLMGKILGSRSWDNKNMCGATSLSTTTIPKITHATNTAKPPLLTTKLPLLTTKILKPVTTKTTTRIPLRPKNATTSSMAPSESSNSNIVLIGGAICGILFVVVLLVILIFVIKKRIVTTRKTTNGKSIKGKKEVIYAEPEGAIEMENISYLTSVKLENKNDPDENIYCAPYENDVERFLPKNYEPSTSPDHHYDTLDPEYEALTHVTGSPKYRTLEGRRSVYEDMSAAQSDDEYTLMEKK